MKKGTRIQQYLSGLMCLCIFTLFILLSGANADTFATSSDEYAVKAACVLNFARFTQWPDSSFEGSDGFCHISVIGDETVEEAFLAIDGKEIGPRKLRVSFARGADDLQMCNAVFIARDIDQSALVRIFMTVKDIPVLTIGETEDFIRLGGMINFFTEDGRVRFEINPRRSQQQHLRLSSRLLSLAVIVEDRQ